MEQFSFELKNEKPSRRISGNRWRNLEKIFPGHTKDFPYEAAVEPAEASMDAAALGKVAGDGYIVADMYVADRFEEKNNDPAGFATGNPAFSMVADAANLAAFYEFLVNGRRMGERQLDPAELVRRCTTRQVSGCIGRTCR